MLIRLFALLVLTVVSSPASAALPRTFCNPLNLDYGVRTNGKPAHRHGADPVIVLFNDRYYLFSTWDKPGYRVSDDLLNWKYIPFAEGVALPGGTYTAAAATVIDGWLYFTEFGRAKQHVALYRTRDPDSGKWEKVLDDLPPYADPCLFLDPSSGRRFMYSGLDQPIRGVELDGKTFQAIDHTRTQLMETFDPRKKIRDGWEVCTWDNNEASKGMRGNKSFFPCREGAWMTFLNGKYYLQYASPGTTVPGYADGLLVGDSPLGPFAYSQHSPIARKASGFITSAGHGCLFQDRHDNWWRAVTMLIGVHERMERRIGLYPAGFDKEGIPYTRTELGDLPITLPDGKRDQSGDDVYAGWWVLSKGATATASTSLEAHPAGLAADEDIRTTWSAATGNAGERLQLDLGREQEVRAAQINLGEQDCDAAKFTPDEHRFVLRASSDGQAWKAIVDRTQATSNSPHTYVAFDEPVRARYFKLENGSTPGGGKFAVSDLRLFGVGAGRGAASGESSGRCTKCNGSAEGRVELEAVGWLGATSYLVRYGITPHQLYQHDLVVGGDATGLTLYGLNNDPPYHFRVDAMNAAGRTPGEADVLAP